MPVDGRGLPSLPLAPDTPGALREGQMRDQLKRALLPVARDEELPEGLHAAVSVILSGAKLQLVLIRRAEHPADPWSGHMALPGGKRELTDVSLLSTAIRETQEETGIVLSESACLGVLSPVRARSSAARPLMWVTPFVFYLPEVPRVLADPLEVADILLIPLVELARYESRSEVSVRRGQEMYRFPSLLLGGRHVWGMTYQMLTELLSRVSALSPF